jgi:hypothetical protein
VDCIEAAKEGVGGQVGGVVEQVDGEGDLGEAAVSASRWMSLTIAEESR